VADSDVFELYLIRHGVAEERSDAWPDDTKRPLTDEGMSRLRKSARSLARLGVSFDVILTSPLVRTHQTAEIVAAAFSPKPAVVKVDALAPDGSTAAVIAELENHVKRTRIAIVGHEPGIGELGARLIGTRHEMEFKKGAIARIDVEQLPPKAPGILRWFIAPKFLRALKK
jgi:phosphohistidine phosphatase